jgi:hypothetical protein
MRQCGRLRASANIQHHDNRKTDKVVLARLDVDADMPKGVVDCELGVLSDLR